MFSKCLLFNPIALRMAKTLWSFGRSECNRVKNIKTVIVSMVRLLIVFFTSRFSISADGPRDSV